MGNYWSKTNVKIHINYKYYTKYNNKWKLQFTTNFGRKYKDYKEKKIGQNGNQNTKKMEKWKRKKQKQNKIKRMYTYMNCMPKYHLMMKKCSWSNTNI